MPQNDYMELYKKRYGKRMDHEERMRKKSARSVKETADKA
jgi:ribosome biogenesis protein NSA2